MVLNLKKGKGVVVGTIKNYYKLKPSERYLMPLIQKPKTKLYIQSGTSEYFILVWQHLNKKVQLLVKFNTIEQLMFQHYLNK